MTPFISTLSEMRVRGRTTQLVPSTVFFSDVFSATVQLSPTAHSVIWLERIVAFSLISGGGTVESFFAPRSLQNSFSQMSKIYGEEREYRVKVTNTRSCIFNHREGSVFIAMIICNLTAPSRSAACQPNTPS